MLFISVLLLSMVAIRAQDDYLSDDHSRPSTNDSGILSDIWTSLTTVNKTSSCPGECVHAITSIFCDKVLEEISCGGNLFRCCVSNSLQQYSDSIESWSSPELIPTTTITTTTTTTTKPIVTTAETFSVIFNNHHHSDSTYKNTNEPPVAESISTNSAVPVTTPIPEEPPLFNFESGRVNNASNSTPCPVKCSRINSNSFCLRPSYLVHCSSKDEECCLETESNLDTMTKNFIKLVQQTVAMNQTKNIGSEFSLSGSSTAGTTMATSTTTTTTASSLPPCEGTCVVPLFHMLCDEIDHGQYCAHGYCCVNREPTTPAPQQISACDGTCLPVILSGMCTKPYELVLKTIDCGTGTICCADKKNSHDNNGDNGHDTEQVAQITPMLLANSVNGAKYPPVPIPPLISIPSSKPAISYPVLPSALNPIPDMKPSTYFSSDSYLSPSLIDPVKNPVHFPPPPPKPPKPDDSIGCPGKCINSMFKFTCLGGYSIYKNFKCAKGQICCASNSEIEKLELYLQTKISQQQQQPNPLTPPALPPPPLPPQHKPKPTPHPPPLPPPPPLSVAQIKPPLPAILESKPSPIIPNENGFAPKPPVAPQPVAPEPTIQITPANNVQQQPHLCGIKGPKRTVRVVGGSDSYPGEWCWQIALVNQQGKYICGGTLIGRQWALTAAHCVTSYVRKNEPVFVRVGEYDLTRNNRMAQTQKVSTIYVHHNHNSQSLDNDIALLKLQSPVELNSNTCLVCLPTWNSDRNQREKRCTVTGYGFQHEAGPMALRIREAQIPIVDNYECINRINSVTEKQFILPASSFCAGGKDGNDACQGDGGSGLVCEADGFYELTGLVSWGFGCGRNGVPGVYVKVSSFVGWINQIVSTNTN